MERVLTLDRPDEVYCSPSESDRLFPENMGRGCSLVSRALEEVSHPAAHLEP